MDPRSRSGGGGGGRGRGRGGGSGGGGAGGRGRGHSGGGPGGRGRGYRPNPNNVAVFRQPNAPYGEGASAYQQGLGSGRSGDGHERGNAPRHATAAPHQGRGSKGGRGGRFEYVEVRSPNPSSVNNG